jgi:hypothetical protein
VLTALESANLKLILVSEHIKTIQRCSRGYARRKPHKILTDAKGKETADISKAPPDDIAVIAGEALYQLRSSLDHLAFDLVKLNATRIQLPSNWKKRCEFPLLTCIPTKGNPPVPCKLPLPYNYFSNTLPGITKTAFTFIESLQPYNKRNVSVICTPTILGWLAHLSNIDKHRHLSVIETNLSHSEILTTTHSTISIARTGLKHGAEIQPRIRPQPYPTVNVKRRFTVYVAFKEPSIGNGTMFSVREVLKFCLQAIKNDIIPAFAQLLK